MNLNYKNEIYIGTVLLEKNRWAQERVPSVAISDWSQRIKDEGFDGIELWQNHALLADDDEKEKLGNSVSPIKIFNSYAKCEIELEGERQNSTEMAISLSASGMKFNFGKVPERHDEYGVSVRNWRSQLPKEFRFLCECHGGTTVQEPEIAHEMFSQIGRGDYEIIIHGFGDTDESIKQLFAIHGESITHIHVDISLQKEMSKKDVKARVDLLKDLGFCGSYTIEFTEGVRDEESPVELLFKNAVRDMNILRNCLA